MTSAQEKEQSGEFRVVEIVEPGTAHVVKGGISAYDKPGVALVRTTYSAVSPGTELLVFNGDMPEDDDSPLDATITELNGEQQNGLYPCRYGYSCVGTITHLGPEENINSVATNGGDAQQKETSEKNSFQVGDRVFAFREHTSHFVQPVKSLFKIPAGVSDKDATLLPTVETALSILFDAQPLPGELVSIMGQGLIGLIVTATTRLLHPFCTVITHDLTEARRKLSQSAVGATYVMDHPATNDEQLDQIAKLMNNGDEEMEVGDEDIGADVSIEVSGSGSGLSKCIETTRAHGRVVLASWYGNKPVVAPALGSTRFHRSHISIVASQVSAMPVAMRGRWSKGRRMDLAWRVVEALKPAHKLDIAVFDPRQAQNVYEQLAKKDIVGGLFQWSTSAAEGGEI